MQLFQDSQFQCVRRWVGVLLPKENDIGPFQSVQQNVLRDCLGSVRVGDDG